MAVALFAVPLSLFAGADDTLGLVKSIPPEYENYAQKGSYLNPTWVGEVPEWNYFDYFGNQLVEGFYLFNMGFKGDAKANSEISDVALSPILKKWLNGLVQVGDITDNRGVMALVGDRLATSFTPYTFNQSLFCGARIDVFFDLLYGLNSLTFINSRVSNTGQYGMYMEQHQEVPGSDWLHGIHLNKKVKDNYNIGATWIDLRNQPDNTPGSVNGSFNKSFPNTVSALQIYGVNGNCTIPKVRAYGEWALSQEVIDGNFKPKPGNVLSLNTVGSISDKLKLGGEGYVVESRYKTTFFDPAFPNGDAASGTGSWKYLYSLVEDNDDKDQFPENGQEGKINFLPRGAGDQDGVMPVKYDKNKNNVYDWEEDFLNYESDPPKSGLYFDRNNNGIPDAVEDDPYPDYTYVPSYYRAGERYLRRDERTGKSVDTVVADSADISFNMEDQASKGLKGFHLYGRYEILPQLSLTLGGIAERSELNSFQTVYEDGKPVGVAYDPEKATTLYSLINYRNDLAADRKLTLDNYFRYVRDNIPNHTLITSGGVSLNDYVNHITYSTVVDQLDYRDVAVEMFVAQFDIYRNRGFNLTSRAKYEFTKHFPHLEYNYPGAGISSLFLVNKCQYIYLIPFSKDMFLIPKFKNIWENTGYSPRADSSSESAHLDSLFRRNTMSNNAYVVYEWRFTPKTSITTGYQYELFNDFHTSSENYTHGNFTLQLMIKDRYAGMNMILTAGFAKYFYDFYKSRQAQHNPLNNPYGITGNSSSYDVFLKIHCGF